MNRQDEKAVESMCQCGLSLDAIMTCFPHFSKKEIREIYNRVKGIDQNGQKQDEAEN